MRIAILGASGLVGRSMLSLLQECSWAADDPLLLTSERSAGQRLDFRGRALECRAVAAVDWNDVDLALFSAGAQASRRYAPVAAQAGVWVVDNSSAWRMDRAVPLVVPEVNAASLVEAALDVQRGGIVANPNCSTIQIVVAAAPLQRAFGLQEVHVTTLQAVSGAGQAGVDELEAQARAGVCWPDPDPPLAPGESGRVFPRRIAFNAVPQIGSAVMDGSFEEELKVERELVKIIGVDDFHVTCTATRVPVWNGHAAACRVVLRRAATRDEVLTALQDQPGLEVAAEAHGYATPAEIDGSRTVHVGRLRRDPGCPEAFLFWVVADNLLKGAAWNAIQIAEILAAQQGHGERAK